MRDITRPNQVLKGVGLEIVLDAGEIYLDNPGQGTPIVVRTAGGRHSGTYHAALDTGEADTIKLTKLQMEWLDSKYDYVADWEEYHISDKQLRERSVAGM